MSTFTCDVCGKYKTPDNSAFMPGVKVKFTITTMKSARTMHTKTVTGVIQDDRGEQVTVKYAGGNIATVSKSRLTLNDAPSPLTLAIFGLCNCEGGAA